MPASTRFVVATHVLVSLAIVRDKPMRSEDLAFSVNTNATVIRALLGRLMEAGLTTSQLGNGGGALLARPAQEICLLDVYRAVEDGEIFSTHRNGPNQACFVGRNIQEAMLPALENAKQALETELAAVTIATIAAGGADLGKFTIPWNGS